MIEVGKLYNHPYYGVIEILEILNEKDQFFRIKYTDTRGTWITYEFAVSKHFGNIGEEYLPSSTNVSK